MCVCTPVCVYMHMRIVCCYGKGQWLFVVLVKGPLICWCCTHTHTHTRAEIDKFFSNELLKPRSSDDRSSSSGFLYFDGQHLLGMSQIALC